MPSRASISLLSPAMMLSLSFSIARCPSAREAIERPVQVHGGRTVVDPDGAGQRQHGRLPVTSRTRRSKTRIHTDQRHTRLDGDAAATLCRRATAPRRENSFPRRHWKKLKPFQRPCIAGRHGGTGRQFRAKAKPPLVEALLRQPPRPVELNGAKTAGVVLRQKPLPPFTNRLIGPQKGPLDVFPRFPDDKNNRKK